LLIGGIKLVVEEGLAVASSLFAGFAAMVGTLIIWKYKEWGTRNIVYLMSFAAGLLLTISIVHIVPEAIEKNVNAPLFLLMGFILFYSYDRLIDNHSINKHGYESNDHSNLGVITSWGIGLHSFIDGVLIMVTFTVSLLTGIATATAMVAHKIPAGVITFLLLEQAGYREKKAFLVVFLVVAITTPLGTIFTLLFLNLLHEAEIGLLLAFSGGGLIYIASRLLPEGENGSKKYNFLSLISGIIFTLVVTYLEHVII
jgi:ZIP family zinc transporter/zinc and cadmium transporter